MNWPAPQKLFTDQGEAHAFLLSTASELFAELAAAGCPPMDHQDIALALNELWTTIYRNYYPGLP